MHSTIDDITSKLPVAIDAQGLREEIRQELKRLDVTIVVLDDDPTGTQTVHDIPVLTSWSSEAIEKEFEAKTPLFYLLTNSRSLGPLSASQLAEEIGLVLRDAGHKFQRKFCVISRSDSTLRGHYPHEVDMLERGLGHSGSLKIIAPAFFEGNRITVDDTHYIVEEEKLVPVSETAYAEDKTFGYKNANLKKWVEEKSNGKIKSEDVYAFSLKDLRSGGVSFVTRQLKTLTPGSTCIVNAMTKGDLDVFVLGLLRSEVPFVGRTAASFVASVGAIDKKPLLSRQDFNPSHKMGSLWIVGSYVPKTTNQLSHLLDNTDIKGLQVDVMKLLDEDQRDGVIRDAVYNINTYLGEGQHVVLYTSRKLIAAEDREASLRIGNQVSRALTEIVAEIVVRPAYILSKGGITSSDIATKSLKVKRALVLGQIIPGVPVWQLGNEAKFPGISYIVYPGNVGDDQALATIYKQLTPLAHE